MKKRVLIRDASTNGIDYTYSGINLNNYKRVNNDEKYEEYKKILSNKSKISSSWHHGGPCFPGIRKLFIDIDGNFYPCEKVMESSANKIGDIKSGFNISRIKEILNIGKLTEDECKKCWAIRFCSICVVPCLNVESGLLCKKTKLLSCQEQKNNILAFLRNTVK